MDRFPDAVTPEGCVIIRYDGPLHYASQAHFKDFVTGLIDRRRERGEKVFRIVLHAESCLLYTSDAADE